MAKSPVAEQVQVNFRMPVALRDRIKAVAEDSGRSMNAEIVQALEYYFPKPATPADVLADVISNLAFYDGPLLEESIELIRKAAEDGRLLRSAKLEASMKRRED